ncbi:MAG: ABC transporter permease subunit [Planctomycetales bacterium]|nr:ABC transporter permease subunit [Planctomycetales bacterium]
MFTESVVLGEILKQTLEAAGIKPVKHKAELGGTRVLFDGLVAGEIDAYVEYTGTLREEIFAGQDVATDEALAAALAKRGIAMSAPLGFNNPYAMAVLRDTAERLKLTKVSDLADHPELRVGLSNEFLQRGDGWPALRAAYRLPQQTVEGMDHALAYLRLKAGQVDFIDAYATDAELSRSAIVVLQDDLDHFPRYDSIVLYRQETARAEPRLAPAIESLAGTISTERMAAMNAAVKFDEQSEAAVAAQFLADELGVARTEPLPTTTIAAQIAHRTKQHLGLVLGSLLPAIAVAIPLGIVAAKFPSLGQAILAVTGVVQTIPSLALLALLMTAAIRLQIKTLGDWSPAALIALFLYSLLPIVRNTAAGFQGIAPHLRESAEALGLSRWYRLRRIELPLATPMILAGVKTAAVMNIGFAALGALIGAGGYGQPIMTGIRLNNVGIIMQGAIPAAVLAIVVQLGFEAAERWLVAPALRQSQRAA